MNSERFQHQIKTQIKDEKEQLDENDNSQAVFRVRIRDQTGYDFTIVIPSAHRKQRHPRIRQRIEIQVRVVEFESVFGEEIGHGVETEQPEHHEYDDGVHDEGKKPCWFVQRG